MVSSKREEQHDATEQDWGDLSQQEDAQQLLLLLQLLLPAVHAGDNGMVVDTELARDSGAVARWKQMARDSGALAGWKGMARDSGALVPFVKQ